MLIGVCIISVIAPIAAAQDAPRPYKPDVIRAIDSDDLIAKLTGQHEEKLGPEEALDDIKRRMGQSADRLRQRDTGDETQEIQARIVKNLDYLIKLINDNRRSNGGAGGAGGGGSATGGSSKSSEAAGGNAPATRSSAHSGDPLAASSQPLQESRMEQMNLPPRDRAAILNGMTHGALPEYKVQIAKYYEALAQLRK